jgi:hypothetical protein
MEFVDIVKSVMSSDKASLIVKAVFLLLIGVGWVFFQNWLHNKAIAAARAEEEKKAQEDKIKMSDTTKQGKRRNR